MLAKIKNKGYFNLAVESFTTLPLFDEKKTYEVTIKEKKNKRSLNQNSMLWALIQRMAEHTDNEPMSIYVYLLEKANIKGEIIQVANDERVIKAITDCFRAYKDLEPMSQEDFKSIYVWVGSSKYDVEEMTKLIEYAYKECAELGIERTI